MRSNTSTLIIFAALTIVGLGLASKLSVQYLPAMQAPRITVQFAWPDAPPDVIEQEVTTPLEGIFNLVQGVRGIYSVSGAGQGIIHLDLDRTADPEYLRFEVAMRIRRIYPGLPPGVQYPVIHINLAERTATGRPLQTWTLSGDAPAGVLYDHAREHLAPALALIPGLQTIQVAGGNRNEWRILYDERKLAAHDLNIAGLSAALQQSMESKNLGTAISGDRRYPVQLAPFRPETPGDWHGIPLIRKEDRIFYLRDLAAVELKEQSPRNHYRINGQNSVRLLIFPERGVNTIALAREVQDQVTRLSPGLPPSYGLHLEEDDTEFLRSELARIRDRTILSVGLLLLFVFLAYRSAGYLLLIILSLTANLGLAFIFYYFLRTELHLYALAGITVSFGLIIDNTIVMAHHLRQEGDRRVFPALLAATLTTLAALTALFFLPETLRLNLRAFAKVVMVNLGVSLIVAWTLIPALSRSLLTGKAKAGRQGPAASAGPDRSSWYYLHEKLLGFLSLHRKKSIALVALAFGLPVFLLPDRVQGWDWYNRTLGSENYRERIKPSVDMALGGTLRLFSRYVYERSAFRQPEETVLYVEGRMPPGATLPQLDAVFRQMEDYTGQFPGKVKKYATRIDDARNGLMRITFAPGCGPGFPYLLKGRLIANSLNLGGVDWQVYGVGQGFSKETGAAYPRFRIKLFGYNKEELKKQVDRFTGLLGRHPRVQKINADANSDWQAGDRYEYFLKPDNRRLAQTGLSSVRLPGALKPFDQSAAPDLFTPDGTPVRLLSDRLPDNDLWLLQNKQLAVNDSTQFVLSNFTALIKQRTTGELHKENQQYIRQVTFEYVGDAQTGGRYLQEVTEQMRREMPPGFSIEPEDYGALPEQRRFFSLIALIAALIFFICAVTFESLRQAFAVVILIPLSFIGIFLTFYWFRFPFDQGGYTSFLLVSGLTVNGLILILNEYNRLKNSGADEGLAGRALYLRAYYKKITPILLTILSTSLGLLPFMIHGQGEAFWFSLAAGTIGGLVFSVLVLTLVTPLFLDVDGYF